MTFFLVAIVLDSQIGSYILFNHHVVEITLEVSNEQKSLTLILSPGNSKSREGRDKVALGNLWEKFLRKEGWGLLWLPPQDPGSHLGKACQ